MTHPRDGKPDSAYHQPPYLEPWLQPTREPKRPVGWWVMLLVLCILVFGALFQG